MVLWLSWSVMLMYRERGIQTVEVRYQDTVH